MEIKESILQENYLKNNHVKINQNKKGYKLTSEQKFKNAKVKWQELLQNETPEQKEICDKKLPRRYNTNLERALYMKNWRRKQIDLAKTPEEREAIQLKKKEYNKKYRERKKALAKTPEEKEALRLKQVKEKRKSRAKLKKLPNRDCKGRLLTPEEVEARKRKQELEEEESLLTIKLRMMRSARVKDYRKRKQAMILSGEVVAFKVGRRRKKEQITSNFPLVIDEIKIEKDVLQETVINTIPEPTNTHLIPVSWQSFKSSEKSWMSDTTIQNKRSFGSIIRSLPESFPNNNSRSTKINQRKSVIIEESCSCMRELIDATSKGDVFTVFGKHIAQKLRSSKKDPVEVDIAMLLVDEVLQDLVTGTQINSVEAIF